MRATTEGESVELRNVNKACSRFFQVRKAGLISVVKLPEESFKN